MDIVYHHPLHCQSFHRKGYYRIADGNQRWCPASSGCEGYCTPGAADVLPAIAEAVKGKVTILADGGVRSGVDVLKMIGLGADGVLIGRPFVTASFGGAKEKKIPTMRWDLGHYKVCGIIKELSADA